MSVLVEGQPWPPQRRADGGLNVTQQKGCLTAEVKASCSSYLRFIPPKWLITVWHDGQVHSLLLTEWKNVFSRGQDFFSAVVIVIAITVNINNWICTCTWSELALKLAPDSPEKSSVSKGHRPSPCQSMYVATSTDEMYVYSFILLSLAQIWATCTCSVLHMRGKCTF